MNEAYDLEGQWCSTYALCTANFTARRLCSCLSGFNTRRLWSMVEGIRNLIGPKIKNVNIRSCKLILSYKLDFTMSYAVVVIDTD